MPALWRKDRVVAGILIGLFDHVLGEDYDGLTWGDSNGGDRTW